MKLYRPAAPFVWINPADPDNPTPQVFNEGLILRADHPAVVDKPLCFVEVTEDNAHGVEQTSANPGEKRNVGRPRSNA